jgi:hypothetical protein
LRPLKAERILYPVDWADCCYVRSFSQALQLVIKAKLQLTWSRRLLQYSSFQNWLRAEDWKNNFAAQATLKTSQNSHFNNMMGLELEHLNKHEEAWPYDKHQSI